MLDRHATRRSQKIQIVKPADKNIGFIITLILPSIQVIRINHRTGRVERLWPTAFICSYASLSQLPRTVHRPPSSSPKPHHGLHSPRVESGASSKLIFKTKIVSSLQRHSIRACAWCDADNVTGSLHWMP